MTKSARNSVELFDENVTVEDETTVKVSQIFDHKYNRNSYIVSGSILMMWQELNWVWPLVLSKVQCLKSNDHTDVVIRKSIKKSSTNQCPLEFFHRINVQCSKPHAIELSKLFSLTQSDKLPVCSLDGVVYANIDNRVYVIRLKNSNGDYFDNFTSSVNQVKWKFNDNQMQINGNLSSIEIHNRTCYYQNFATHHVVGESNLEANLANLNGALKIILVDWLINGT